MKVIVVSDDFTGAAEVAGAAHRLGINAEVHVGDLHHSQADFIAIDTNTRSLSPEAAATVVSNLTRNLPASQECLVIKKIDSVLRGPILAELAVMAGSLSLDRCLLVCGNPRKSRFVLEGQLFIDNQPLSVTEFSEDFEYPCWTGDVVKLLTSNTRDVLCDNDAFDHTLRVINPGDLFLRGISIGNVKDVEDIFRYADSWFQQRNVVLAAGAAEFIEALIRKCFCRIADLSERAQVNPAPSKTAKALLVTGTRNPQDTGWPIINLHPESELADSLTEISQTIQVHGRAAIRARNKAYTSPDIHLSHLTQLATQAIYKMEPSEVWIEGGKTASSVIRKLGHEKLTADINFHDGIVGLRCWNRKGPLFVVKPGSYPWPAAIPREALEFSSNRSVEAFLPR